MSAMSTQSLWPLVADARAAVTTHLTVIEQRERGQDSVVVRNETSGIHVRVDPAVWALVRRLDGRRSVVEAIDSLHSNNTSEIFSCPESRERLAQALITLEQAGLLRTGLPGAANRCYVRSEQQRKSLSFVRWTNPLSIRIPLHDPDRLLSHLVPHLNRLAIKTVFILCSALTLLSLVTLVTAHDEIVAAFTSLAASPRQWWTVLLVWPVLKLAHELAHAIAVHRYGGCVHEWGVTFLVLMPVPYVDASDSALFARRHRLIVCAAGMAAELLLAAFALLMWSLLEPGILKGLAFAIVVAGSINTVVFNANPLLRFDGYYLLQDVCGLQNLATRASRWWLAWLRLRLFGLEDSAGYLCIEPAERRWLALYGALSIAYRYVIVASITLWLLDTLPMIGLVLAAFALWPLVVKPVIGVCRWLSRSQALEGQRSIALRKAGIYLTVLAFVIGIVPFPSSTRVIGVLAVEGTAALVAPEAGRLLVLAHNHVKAGEVLARIESPELNDEAHLLNAERHRLDSARKSVARTDIVEAKLLDRELAILDQRKDTLDQRIAALEIRANRAGRFVPTNGDATIGRLLSQGDPIGQIVDGRTLRVQAIVLESQLERLRDGVREVHVRLAESVLEPIEASLVQQTPSADRVLPSAALAGTGVGGIAVTEVNNRLETLEPVFHVELGLPDELDVIGIGGRAYVTFAHPAESLADRWWRLTRQLFLERLVV